jgi:hypothetical protein
VPPVFRHALWGANDEYQTIMSINQDQVKGRINEAKGKSKEVAGKIVGADLTTAVHSPREEQRSTS